MFQENLCGIQFWSEELQLSRLPDERFRSNLVKMCHSLQEKPGHSFSAACGPGVRKSAHRLFSKESSIDIQYGHRKKTIDRCNGHDLILVIEDTTDLNYHGHKATEGLGIIGGNHDSRGLCIHSAMVLSEQGEPFGLIGQHIWAPSVSGREHKIYKYPIEEKESYKWIRTKKWVNEWFDDYPGQVIVVGDREADFYEHFTWPRKESIELLVRGKYLNRKIFHKGERTKLRQIPQIIGELGKIKVRIGRQKKRKARTATLSIRATKIECPPASQKKGERISLSLVHVKEEAEKGVKEPVEWYLLTSLEVNDFEKACQVLNFYVLRWPIERFHLVLKSGLKVEGLQFDTFTRLKHALEVCSLVAWQLLWMAYIAKAKPNAEAEGIFEAIEIKILEQFTGRKIKTITDFILTLGTLSGFVKSKAQPLPGEKLLWQSLKLLRAMKSGYTLKDNIS